MRTRTCDSYVGRGLSCGTLGTRRKLTGESSVCPAGAAAMPRAGEAQVGLEGWAWGPSSPGPGR